MTGTAGGGAKVLTRPAETLDRGLPYGTPTMKIGERTGIEPTRRIASAARPLDPFVLRPGSLPVGRVEVARTLAKLMGPIADGMQDPARAAQVEILRNAVATGRYEPDLHEVARKLLAEVAAGR